ncbi:putative o-methyltransferase b protein [Rosellinia necatrix]|uniref:Putative o-methyltransferase b protein n=1 Tax=Rosellinia necatrix TaxID=77044 RepID=A0A1W2TVD3_ROSNE|nr:putative o-methyltransferase b protein [Rosellinia necatrix]
MDAALEQLRSLATQADSADRHKVLDAIRDLQLQLETPHDTLSRFSGLQLEITAARIGVDLGIFKTLAESARPLGAAALSSQTNAAPLVTGRILRYLASVGMIQEVSQDSFAANAITKTLAQPGYEGGVRHFFDNVGPVLQAFPDFLAEIRYQDVSSATNSAFQRAFATDLPAFAWLPTRPERFAPLQQVMTVHGVVGAPWFSVFPFEEELGDFAGPSVFVDVGGGFGHQCLALLTAFPRLRGKIILQDLPQTFEQIPFKLDGVEPTPHNFFEPQPVKGARFYYLRNILHDWPDDKCVAILQQLIAAFGPDSQILIDEMVLPDSGVTWEATTLDLTLMASLGSCERTTAQWHGLLDAAGLKILCIDTYHARRQDSIIQCIPK